MLGFNGIGLQPLAGIDPLRTKRRSRRKPTTHGTSPTPCGDRPSSDNISSVCGTWVLFVSNPLRGSTLFGPSLPQNGKLVHHKSPTPRGDRPSSDLAVVRVAIRDFGMSLQPLAGIDTLRTEQYPQLCRRFVCVSNPSRGSTLFGPCSSRGLCICSCSLQPLAGIDTLRTTTHREPEKTHANVSNPSRGSTLFGLNSQMGSVRGQSHVSNPSRGSTLFGRRKFSCRYEGRILVSNPLRGSTLFGLLEVHKVLQQQQLCLQPLAGIDPLRTLLTQEPYPDLTCVSNPSRGSTLFGL